LRPLPPAAQGDDGAALVRAAAAARRRLRGTATTHPTPAPGEGYRDVGYGSKARGGSPRARRGREPVTAFVVLGVVLVAGALLFIVPPLARRAARSGATRDEVNVAVYRDQMRELESDLRAGTLAPDQHEKARLEIEARLAADLGKGDSRPESPRGSRAAALALGLAVPLCALGV